MFLGGPGFSPLFLEFTWYVDWEMILSLLGMTYVCKMLMNISFFLSLIPGKNLAPKLLQA